MIALLVIVGLVVVGAVVVALSFNGIVRLRNQVDNGWAQIDVQLKRRADLIPNLVETVKGYAAHERGTLDEVVRARNAGVVATTPAQAAAAEGPIEAALGRLFALAEAYPDLKADANFRELQAEISGTEDRIAYARQVYNDSVTRYHDRIDTFPGMLVARTGNFPHRELFETDEPTDRAVPEVRF